MVTSNRAVRSIHRVRKQLSSGSLPTNSLAVAIGEGHFSASEPDRPGDSGRLRVYCCDRVARPSEVRHVRYQLGGRAAFAQPF
jgi:hypothetical protein